MKNSYQTSSSQYTIEKSQAGNSPHMKQTTQEPSITYYDDKNKMKVTITYTKEITKEEIDKELTELLESHYLRKIKGK